MKLASFVCLFQCLTTTFSLSQSNPVPPINPIVKVVSLIGSSQADAKAQAKILDSYGRLPLRFEANHGQTDKRVKFLSRTSGYTLFLTEDEAVLALRGKRAKRSSLQGLERASWAATDSTVRLRSGHTLEPGHSSKTESTAGPASGVTTIRMGGGVLRMKLRDANPEAKVTGVDELAATSNYFIGNDSARWRNGVQAYAKVKCEGVYSGIDLVYYGNQRQLEYDFIVAPGADPRRIAFDVRGAMRIRQDEDGDLVIKMSDGEIRWHKPVAYQEKNGARHEIAARYSITDTNRVGFEVEKYDASRALYIDPLLYSTYLGGSGTDNGFGIAVDGAGNAYVTGSTDSTDFPITPGAFQTNGDIFVSKLNSTGSALVYSTYFGGGADHGQDIAVDSAGNAYVVGYTFSPNFPTKNPLQAALNGGSDAFVTKLNSTGSALIYSTYLGGSNLEIVDEGGIAVDSAGNAYVTGRTNSTDFPTMNPLQPIYGGGWDGFVAKLNATGSALVYSTYLGGSSVDDPDDIAVDRAGNAYVTGYTESKNFPTTLGAFQTVCGGGICGNADAFVAKINPSGSALVYSTYLGGSGAEYGQGIAADSAGNAYVVGYTRSTDFPTQNPLQAALKGGSDAFVTKLNPTGSALIYSTYLGGRSFDYGTSIAVDGAGNAYVTGSTNSTNFPITPGAFQTVCNGGSGCSTTGDVFVSKLNSMGSALVYSTYLGGSGSDAAQSVAVGFGSQHNVYLTGGTGSTNFPLTKKPFQGANAGGDDAFVTKIDMRAATTTILSSSPNPSSSGQPVTFTAEISSSAGVPPDGETVTFKKGTKILGTGALGSGSASFTTSTLPVGTNAIYAVYSGDSEFAFSTSKIVNQVVQ